MEKLTPQEKKLIEKYKRKVHKQYPGAYLSPIENGYYTIVQEQDDLSTKDILAEFCFQPVKSIVQAWELAQTSSKVNQNLNRTHPLRIEGMNMEDKISRVEARRLRSESKKESRKRNEFDIY